MLLSAPQVGGPVCEEAKLKVFRCESYMLCPEQRGKELDLRQIPRNQVGLGLFESEENAQERCNVPKRSPLTNFTGVTWQSVGVRDR